MIKSTPIRIATRKSPLALWQANYVKEALIKAHPDLQVELITMVTKGDIILDTPLAKAGGKGLFVKELKNAMLEGRADLAVHSMKDVPVDFPKDSDWSLFVSARTLVMLLCPITIRILMPS